MPESCLVASAVKQASNYAVIAALILDLLHAVEFFNNSDKCFQENQKRGTDGHILQQVLLPYITMLYRGVTYINQLLNKLYAKCAPKQQEQLIIGSCATLVPPTLN